MVTKTDVILPNNLVAMHQALQDEIEAAVLRVLRSGWYILGPEVEAFEQQFAAYHQRAAAVAVANGTDAIELALRAAGIGQGDEVITVAHTAIATVVAIERAGAKPVLVDIDPQTYTIAADAVEAAITPRTKALVPVHIYGQTADLTRLVAIAEKHHLLLLEDCAQAHGAKWQGRLAGTFGQVASFSFYPTKNVGAYGDGGAVLTDDLQMAERLRRLRNYGQKSRYHAIERGMNSRMDEVQGAILAVKLCYLDAQNAERQRQAALYAAQLHAVPALTLPYGQTDANHIYHLYVIRLAQRDALQRALAEHGIQTLIHYPIPIHRQESHHDLGYGVGSLPVTERIAQEILSLPLYIGLTDEQNERIATAIKGFFA
jgi:dTDP-4-amino-4,6-dideoxygalactose transaminase